MKIFNQDTIVGPGTSFGQGGIGIIRMSGGESLSFLQRFFRPSQSGNKNPASHRLYHGFFFDNKGEKVDEVMAVYMRAPRTYTREDVVEIHCHGGVAVGHRILEALRNEGARLAEPGEFTLRAFLNGRIDLTQAEGVMEVIEADNVASQKVALRHLEGSLWEFCQNLRDNLADSLALLETWIDFPEEDIDHPSQDIILGTLNQSVKQLDDVVRSFHTGRILRHGVSVLILGKPNVGKSSLLNALIGSSRAIVTDLPGTTRDVLEEYLDIEGLRVRLIDTAGVRESADLVEQEGVRRARGKISEADLVLLVVDGHSGVDADDLAALSECGDKKVIFIVNKSDLEQKTLPPLPKSLPRVFLSARKGEGLADLKHMIYNTLCGDQKFLSFEGVIITEERHFSILQNCLGSLEAAQSSLVQNLSPELTALDLRSALDFLGEITGESTPEDIINRIFSRFCIGK